LLGDATRLRRLQPLAVPIAATTLLRHGCNCAQGVLLSRPVAADAMEQLLSTRRIPLPFSATDVLNVTEVKLAARPAAS
jgi:hypothetical protein